MAPPLTGKSLILHPGELQRLVACVAACRANIHRMRHERALPGLAPTRAAVTLAVETHSREPAAEIARALAAAGFSVRR
jgi:hypothetical protein